MTEKKCGNCKYYDEKPGWCDAPVPYSVMNSNKSNVDFYEGRECDSFEGQEIN